MAICGQWLKAQPAVYQCSGGKLATRITAVNCELATLREPLLLQRD